MMTYKEGMTVYIARGKYGDLRAFAYEPERAKDTDYDEGTWLSDGAWMLLDSNLYPEITWESGPMLAEFFSQSELDKFRKKCSATSLMDFLDDNKKPDKKMCLSNGECEQIDDAWKSNDWKTIIKYIRKYIDIEKLD